MVQIKLEYLGRAHAHPEAERDDAPRGGAGDEVEMIGDAYVEILFQMGKNGRRKHSTDFTTIDGKYMKFMVFINTLFCEC